MKSISFGLILSLFFAFNLHSQAALNNAGGINSADKSDYIPYYGSDYYQQIKSGVQNEDLKSLLYSVLSSAHKVSDKGDMDTITSACDSVQNCKAHTAYGYDRARSYLMGRFYLIGDASNYGVREVYCQKNYYANEFGAKKPGPNQVPDNTVVNIEHTWPQSRFTGKFNTDLQKSDMHHLFPTDSKMNSSRSSFPFGEVAQDKINLKCPISRLGNPTSGSNQTVFEPPAIHRGNVARAIFYFSVRYKLPIDPSQESFLRKWHREDPVDDEERHRNDEIYKLQGNRNPFIDYPELADLIQDF